MGRVAPGTLIRPGRFIPYLYTFGAEFLVVLALALTMKLAGLHWGVAGFAVYTLFRRVVAFALPVVTLGLDISLPRHVAIVSGQSRIQVSAYLQAATWLCAATAALLILIFMAVGEWVAALAFGAPGRVDWLPSLAAMLIGYSFYLVVFAFWRGTLRVGRSSTVMVLALAVIPVLVVGVTARDVFTGMIQIGAGALGVAVAFFPWRHLAPVPWRAVVRCVRELVVYGAPRLVCGAALLLLFALPAVHAARRDSLELAGVLAFGVTVVGMLGSAVGPVGTILLPRASRLASEGRLAVLGPELRRWLWLVAVVGCLATVLLILFAEHVIGFFVPGDVAAYLPAFRIMLAGILPFMHFCLMRHIIDARGGLAHNSANAGLALLLYLALSLALAGELRLGEGMGESIALGAALLLLSVATHIRAFAALRGGRQDRT